MLVSISVAKLTEGQDVTELNIQLMLYPYSHILTASKLFTDWFCFKFNQQACKCFSTTTLLHSKANSRLLSCPHVPLHHLSLLCWCSCLWDNIENQQRYSAKKVGFRGCGGWVFLITKYHHSAASLVGFEHYSDNCCTDTDCVDLMSNPSSSFPNSATGEKSWPTKSEETIRWPRPLLPIQKAPIPWLTIAISRGDSFIMFLIKTGFLASFNYSSHLPLVPKSSHSWKYSADELWLRQHWNSLVPRTFALSDKAPLLGE